MQIFFCSFMAIFQMTNHIFFPPILSQKLPIINIRGEGQEMGCQNNIWPKKKICVFTVRRPSLIFGPDPNFFIALLVENYLKTLF